MTTEEIEKAIERFTEERRHKSTGYPPKEWFKAGAEFADNHWQEKTRWIPVEEKLPLKQKKTRQILAKNKHTISVVFIGCTEEGYLNSIESLKREFTDWKEIE